MLSQHWRRRLYQVISIVLCVTMLTESSPLIAGPDLRPRPERRALSSGGEVRHEPASDDKAGVAARALARPPSRATSPAARSTPQPGPDQGRPIAVQAALRLPPPARSLPRARVQQSNPPPALSPAEGWPAAGAAGL